MRIILFVLCLLCPPVGTALALPAQISERTAARVLGATLMLRSADQRDRFLGSAFVFGSDERALTNAHVVGTAKKVIALTQSGARITARVVAIDPARDLALLELETPHGPPLEPSEVQPAPGQPVYAAGAPLEAGFSLTVGIISALARQIEPTQPVRYLQHSAAVNPGSSGGPLVDATGRVLGLNSRISDGSRFFVGIAYAVPVADLGAFLAAGSPTRRAAPGVQLRPIDPRMRAALGFDGSGVLVEEVRRDSPAERAGLRAGDILVAMDGASIAAPGDMAFALATLNDEITMTVLRGDQDLRLTLSRRPQGSAMDKMPPRDMAQLKTYGLADLGMDVAPDGTIIAVTAQGPGFFAGLSPGDRIAAINGADVSAMPAGWLARFRLDAPVLVRINLPDGASRHYVLDPWDDSATLRRASAANVLDSEVVSFE